MKARNVLCLILGVCLAALLGQAWAADSGPAPNLNAKGLILDAPRVSAAGAPQSLRIQGEEVQMQAPQPEPEPDILYTLTGKRQGGEDVATAFVIPGMPFLDTGTTVGYADNYSEACDGLHFAARPDVVYSYTPDIDELVDIRLCNSSYATRMWIYETTAGNMVACNRFGTGICSLPRSALLDVPMDSAVTYYIVIDGDYQITPNQGQYVIDASATIAPQPDDSVRRWPAFADNKLGTVMLGFSFNDAVDSALFWQSSIDDGATYGPAAAWNMLGFSTYGANDYWGQDSIFYGTFVPDFADNNGGPTYLHRFYDATDPASWTLSYWNWTTYGWNNMKMADIATDNAFVFSPAPGDHRFGIISMVHSSTYGTPAVGTDAPHLFYQTDSSNFATISWYNDLNGCRSTMCDIDKITKYSYAAYDRYNTTSAQWELFVRGDIFGNPDDTIWSGGYTYTMDPGEHVGYPAVAANNGNVLIVSEFYAAATPTDRDIILWSTPTVDGRYDNLVTSVVIATPDDERFPRIQVISGNSFIVTYVANSQLYMTVTEDGGTTWSTPTVVSGTDVVVSEYRSADIADFGRKVMWEYQPGLPADTSIFLHWAETGVVQDGDGDEIEDDLDNCPLIANPGQEDADNDGIGDVCDECTDTDGDGYGNPGFAANTCTLDNCPTTANPTQANADGDGFGDVCDECTDTDADGYGNPGYPANTCAVDNCPTTVNPGQQDTNNDGIGDACCCIDLRGNINGDATNGNVADLTYLVNFLFKAGPVPPCPLEADVNGTSPVNVADLTYMVNFLFKAGPAPLACP